MIRDTDASVFEEVAFPAVQSMCCRTDIKQNNLRKAFNQPIAGDHLPNLLIRNRWNLFCPRNILHEYRAVSFRPPCLERHRSSIRSLPLRFSRTNRCMDRYRCSYYHILSSWSVLSSVWQCKCHRLETSLTRWEKNIVLLNEPLFATSHETSNNHLFISSAISPLSRQVSKWIPW